MYKIITAMSRFVYSFFVMLCLTACGSSSDPTPPVASGTLERIEGFRSQHVTPRHIDIWLPEGYADGKEFPVLYMHDGQNLYDAEGTWNNQAWDIDDVASRLFSTDSIREFIVVGIWNGGKTRHPDYFPQKPFEQMSQEGRDTVTAQLRRASHAGRVFAPQSDSYLKFIVEELKPFIEDRYSVQTGRDNAFIAGASMGGMISLYALCEYPELFGGAACLSTHWVGTFDTLNNPFPDAYLEYLGRRLPAPEDGHRVYFDCGDQTLDAMYPTIQRRVDSLMRSKGYDETNWMTLCFPGEDHSERAWNKRLHLPLEFLFAKPRSKAGDTISTGI